MYLTQALHRTVQQDGWWPLTIFEDRLRSVAECADRVGRLAAGLRALGVGRRDRVALLGTNSLAIRDCGADVLIVDESLLPAVPSVREHAEPSAVVVMAEIISGGENVYSAEVENVLMPHPVVAAERSVR